MIRRYVSLLIVLFIGSDCAFAQAGLPTDYLSPQFHEGRREALRELMPEKSVAVVFAYPVRNFSNDVDYLYHANPDMYYFTGYREPHSILFIFKEDQKSPDGKTYNELFFVQERNAQAERWNGRRLGVEGVKSTLELKNVYAGKDFADFAIDFSDVQKIISANIPNDVSDSRWDKADLFDLIKQFKEKAGLNETGYKRFDRNLFAQLTGRLREIKTP